MNNTNTPFTSNPLLLQLSNLFPESNPKMVQYIANALSQRMSSRIATNISEINTTMPMPSNFLVESKPEMTSMFDSLSTCGINTAFCLPSLNSSKISTSLSMTSITEDRKETFEEFGDDNISDLTSSIECSSALTSQKYDNNEQTEKDRNILETSKKIKKERDQSKDKQAKLRSRKGLWTEEEDIQLRELVAQHGQKWAQIANMIGGKNGKQVRDRYMNISRPDINYGKWSKEEDQLFVTLLDKYGRRWCQIAAEMPGRTESQVKSKFYCLKRNKDNDDLKKKTLRKAVEHVEKEKTRHQVEKQNSEHSRANFQDIDVYFEFNPNQEKARPPHKDDIDCFF